MNPLTQLKENSGILYLTKSCKQTEYDHCPDFHFLFDVEIGRKVSYDAGSEYAPETFEANDTIEIFNLLVMEDDTFTYVDISESEKDEIIKELLTKIQIT